MDDAPDRLLKHRDIISVKWNEDLMHSDSCCWASCINLGTLSAGSIFWQSLCISFSSFISSTTSSSSSAPTPPTGHPNDVSTRQAGACKVKVKGMSASFVCFDQLAVDVVVFLYRQTGSTAISRIALASLSWDLNLFYRLHVDNWNRIKIVRFDGL